VFVDNQGPAVYVAHNPDGPVRTLLGLNVTDNKITGQGNDAILMGGLFTAVSDLNVSRNLIDTVSSAGLSQTGIRAVFATVAGFTIEDNQISAVQSEGILVQIAAALDDLSVCGNKIDNVPNDAGIKVQVVGQIRSCTVDDNKIRSVATAATRNHAILVEGSNQVFNLSVSGNTVRATGFGAAVDEFDAAISVRAGDAAMNNVTVDRNNLTNINGGALYLGPSSTTLDCWMFNLSACDNKVYVCSNSGIYVDLREGLTAGDIGASNVSVSRNHIFTPNGDNESGIIVTTPAAAAVWNLTVQENVVDLADLTPDTTHGIRIQINDRAESINVIGNQIQQRVEAARNLLWINTTSSKGTVLARGISVVDNKCRGVNSPSTSTGINLVLRRDLQHFQCIGNSVHGTGNGLIFDIGAAGPSGGSGKAIHFMRNSVRGIAGGGDVVRATGAALPAGTGSPTDGWFCSHNASSGTLATGSWASTGDVGAFCEGWSIGEKNVDNIS
jgi:hypothetical protein